MWVKVKAYARPKEFDGMEYMQEDMVKLIRQHGEDIKDIAQFFEKNNYIRFLTLSLDAWKFITTATVLIMCLIVAMVVGNT